LGLRIVVPAVAFTLESRLVPGDGVRLLGLRVHEGSLSLEFRKVFVLAKVEVEVKGRG
jgi:hypothetical protein